MLASRQFEECRDSDDYIDKYKINRGEMKNNHKVHYTCWSNICTEHYSDENNREGYIDHRNDRPK
jgi:hypothetical protein